MGLPFDAYDGAEIVSKTLESNSRWSLHYSLVFRLPDQTNSEAWQVGYRVGATECQEEGPWEYESEVAATLVHRTTKTIEVWEPVTNG